MSGTRRFEPTIQLDSGLIIPAGAGAGKILTSDGSGNASWASSGINLVPTAKTTTYTAAAGDAVIATSGTFTVTSPAASAGRLFSVNNKGTGVVTVTAAAGVIRGPGLTSSGQASIVLGFTGGHVLLLSDGTDWFIKGGGPMPSWTTVTPGASFTNSGNPVQYMRDMVGFVHVRGGFSAIAASGGTAFTFPAGFRPGQAGVFPIIVDGVSSAAQANIATSGVVSTFYAGAHTTMNLDGAISFLAEN